ncbi:preprotein translocase subunit SecG [Spirosoma aureum]|jgi:preprotein translocase subunit SecG|uniref:Protein-export membrane protein SecG n=1 Tax=Spirosoma aureum TaxID=2692134 RepID=A0A6G9AS86_9BACT|nr:preprotein translocase subunit SecG [Spirosoma aureum]QIP15337.1 preprotein translocase subunit SecG [Spirosoma aureum]
MVTATIVITCILTVLLILIVLIQNSKGGGLAGEFGGLGSNQLMGVKKTTDLLEQITWGLGIGVMVLSLASYIMIDRNQVSGVNSINVDRAQTQTLPGAAAPTPAAGAAPSQAVPGAATPGASTSALTPQK